MGLVGIFKGDTIVVREQSTAKLRNPSVQHAMNEMKPTEVPLGVRIFEGKLHRVQRGHGKAFVEGPPQPPPEPVRRPARAAVMLALAHKIQDAIDRGVTRDRAEVARQLGFTRARVTVPRTATSSWQSSTASRR